MGGEPGYGDLKALDRELDRYLMKRTLPALAIRKDKLPPANVRVRALSAGEAAMMPMRMQSERGVDAKLAQRVYADGARVAAAYPNDAGAQSWFAEMAFDAGRDAEGEAAADRALAADPKSMQALIYKAMIRLRRAAVAKSGDPAVWKEARSWIVKANHVDPDAAEPLAMFYTSFAMANQQPTKSAVTGLRRAFELVPQDRGLRFMTARQEIVDRQYDAAKVTLRALAYAPHASPDNQAAKILALLETKDFTGAERLAEANAGKEEGEDASDRK